MNLHEHQAKALLAEYGVPIPRGKVAFSVDEALAAASELGLPVVVKAQIHAGGRGKAGGVRLARTEDEGRAAADAILGATLVTKQTGPEGRLVRRLLVEEGVAIARELYVSFIIDRSTGRPMCIASAAGGMDIEEVAAETPEKILTVTVDPAMGMQPFQARRLAFGLGFEGPVFRNGTKFLTALYRAFEGLDIVHTAVVEVEHARLVDEHLQSAVERVGLVERQTVVLESHRILKTGAAAPDH